MELASQGMGEEKFIVTTNDPMALEIIVKASSRVAEVLARNRNIVEVSERPAPPSSHQPRPQQDVSMSASSMNPAHKLAHPDARCPARMERAMEATPGLKELFIVAIAAIQGVRLRIEKNVVEHVEGLQTQLNEARRLAEEKRFTEAFDKCNRVHLELKEKVKKWERKAMNRLGEMRERRQMGKLEQLKNEMADVQKQSQGASVPLMRLRSALEILARQVSGKAR